MFQRKRYRERERKIVYRDGPLLKWGVIALVVYIIAVDVRDNSWFRDAPDSKAIPESVQVEDGVEPGAAPTGSDLVGPPLPEQPFVQVTTLHPGAGEPVRCGDEITVQYVAYLQDNSLFDMRDATAPLTFVPGRGQVLRGLELGAVGMRPDETRQIVVPPALVRGAPPKDGRALPDAWLAYKVELKRVAVRAPASMPDSTTVPMKAFDEKKGEGWEARCGDTVRIRFRAYAPDGAVIKETVEAMPYAVGGADGVPGLDEALLGMRAGGKKFLVLPPFLLQPRGMGEPALPSGQTLLVELTLDGVEY